jgi:hypothetical protein
VDRGDSPPIVDAEGRRRRKKLAGKSRPIGSTHRASSGAIDLRGMRAMAATKVARAVLVMRTPWSRGWMAEMRVTARMAVAGRTTPSNSETEAHDGGGAHGDDDKDERRGADDRGLERNEFLREIHERIGAWGGRGQASYLD